MRALPLLLLAALATGCFAPVAEPLPDVAPPETRPGLRVQTALGSFTLVLYEAEAPRTVAQVQALAGGGFYNGSLFDRVVDNFVIQGGAPPPGREEAPRLPLEAHPALTFAAGTVGMARELDPDSGTSVFFVCEYPQPHLRKPEPGVSQLYGEFTAFGQVVDGMDVVRAVAAQPTQRPVSEAPVSRIPMTVERVDVPWNATLEDLYPLRAVGRVAAPPYRVLLETADVVRAGAAAHLAWYVESQADRSAQTDVQTRMQVDGPWRGELALARHPQDANIHLLAEPFPLPGDYEVLLVDGARTLASFRIQVAPAPSASAGSG